MRVWRIAGIVALAAMTACGDAADVPSGGGEDVGSQAGKDLLDAVDAPLETVERESPIRALLVGVGDYAPGSELAALAGPARDVAAMRRMLVERFGVPEANVRALVDRDATVDAILEAFDTHLLQGCRPGDEALFYFAGHGSRVPDATGRELDGKDSTLLAYDSRVGTKRELTDDILYSLFRALAERVYGVHVSVLVDACHSGDILRSADDAGIRSGVRAAPADGTAAVFDPTAWSVWPDQVEFFDDDDGNDRAALADYVQFSACGPRELAYEYGPRDRARGLFSLCLEAELRQVTTDTTFRSLAHRVVQRMHALPDSAMQTVWTEGSGMDRAVLGGAFHDRVAGYSVEFAAERTLRIAAGLVHGVREGMELAVCAEDGSERGRARVARVEFGRCNARWEGETDVRAGEPLYARIADVPETSRLRVRCADESVRQQLGGSRWVEFVSGEAPYVLWVEDDAFVLRTSEGVRVACDVPRAAGLAAFERECGYEARFQDLWSLGVDADPSVLPDVHAEWVTPDEGELEPRYRAAGIEHAPRRGATPELRLAVDSDQLTVLEVRNDGDVPVYPYVLSLTEARKVTMLEPWPDQAATVVNPGKTRRVRISLSAAPREAFPLTRPMMDRHLVIFSTRPIDHSLLEHSVGACDHDPTRGAAEASPPRGLRWLLLRGEESRPAHGLMIRILCRDLRIRRG